MSARFVLLSAVLKATCHPEEDVIEAQHQSTTLGGSDAQTVKEYGDPDLALSIRIPEAALASRDRSEGCCVFR
jgi:hypothetical protein